MRYVVVLKSLLPLQLYVCDEFYIRWTYSKFMMAETNYTNYDTHFTVNNYNESGAPKLRCGPFMEQFNKEYESRGVTFQELNKKVHSAIADVFIAFQTRYGKEIESLGNIDKSRAFYGVDAMID